MIPANLIPRLGILALSRIQAVMYVNITIVPHCQI